MWHRKIAYALVNDPTLMPILATSNGLSYLKKRRRRRKIRRRRKNRGGDKKKP